VGIGREEWLVALFFWNRGFSISGVFVVVRGHRFCYCWCLVSYLVDLGDLLLLALSCSAASFSCDHSIS